MKSRFVDDMKAVVNSLEASFLKLAEVQHSMENESKPHEALLAEVNILVIEFCLNIMSYWCEH